MTDEYITRAEAEKVAGVSRRIIQLWLKNGVIREYGRAGGGGHTMLRRAEVEAAARIEPKDEPKDA